MENKKMSAEKLAKLTLAIGGKEMVVNDISLTKVMRNNLEVVDITLTGIIGTEPTTIARPAATIAALGRFVGEAKLEEATKKAAVATGVVLGAVMHHGTNVVKDFIHGAGRDKNGPRKTNTSSGETAATVEDAADNTDDRKAA